MTRTREPIAIVGMSCRFPGAPSVDALWELLRSGLEGTSETPADRYDLDAFYQPVAAPGKVVSRRSGYLPQAAEFDADFFGIVKAEAAGIDPQQRLLLMTAWEALEDAGLPPERVAGTRAGVYVGTMHADYWDLHTRRAPKQLNPLAIYNYRSMLSGRLSYTFDLRGPSMTLDTACSSSLTAVHLACQSLRAGETQLALAAGVNLKLLPDEDILLSQVQMLAPDGRCKFGDARANGLAASDGVGVIVLKPLSSALADGDRVRALILGGAACNDGRSHPEMIGASVEGFSQVLRWAYEDAGVSPADVDFIEAHGTGTPMIDPVEFTALGEVLGEDRPATRPCYVGSVKSNIGHTEGAAGIAGLIKTVLCLQHRQIVPSLHYESPNPKIPWARLPVQVPTATVPLAPMGRPALAGVSGQGISGSQVHLVIGEADQRTSAAPPAGPYLFVTSAATDAALRELARSYLDYLAPHGKGAAQQLAEICHTAATRRPHHSRRFAVVVQTHQDLADRLTAFLAGEAEPDPGSRTDLATVASQYREGKPIEWSGVYDYTANPVPLPTYPWQTKRYWLNL